MKQQTVPRPLLALLAVILLAGGYLAQGSLLGSDGPSENGVGDFSPIAFSDGDSDDDKAWEMPANPRNPFLPFYANDVASDGQGQDAGFDLDFIE